MLRNALRSMTIGAIIALPVLCGSAIAIWANPDSQPAPAPQPVVQTVTLAQVLPFYGKDAPEWCLEDMACWIGSNADGRSDAEIVAQMADNIEEASRAYGDDAFPDWEPVETATLPDGSFLVDALGEGERQDYTGCLVHFDDTTVIVCPDGYVETS